MSSDPQICLSCEEAIQHEDSSLCKDCLNNLKKAQKNIIRLSKANLWVSSDIARKEILVELGKACYRELCITENAPELRVIKKEDF